MKHLVMYLLIKLLLLSEIHGDLGIGTLKRSLFVILPMFASSVIVVEKCYKLEK